VIDRTYSNLLDRIRRHVVSNNPEQAWVIDNLAFLHVGGSTLYGTATDTSDLDVRGVTIAPKSFWVGARHFEQLEATLPPGDPAVGGRREVEVVIYDVRKWLHLAVAVNPNVVETLFVEDDSPFAIVATDAWRHVRSETKPLLNQRAHAGFHGYATSQLRKMMVKQSNKTGRREVSDEFGFDLKFASHGFRLASQGAELLRTGKITFPRPDREHLAAVRYGKVYGPGDMDRCIADLSAATAELDRAFAETVLPPKCDFDRYDRLLMYIYDRFVAPRE
jgi:hypothetical protein